jgi:hypothetical protein
MDPNQMTPLNRRNMLLLAGALAAPGFAPATTEFDAQTQDPWMDDPEKSYINFVRLMGDTSGRISPQWWRGAYMGVFEDRHPEPLFRLESCEMKRCLRVSAHEYEFQLRIFTMFRDPVSNEILHGKRWRNPITGKDVVVEPNVSGADKIVKLVDGNILDIVPARGTEMRVNLWWSAQGPYMMAHTYRERSKDRVIPLQDYLTLFGDRAAAADFAAPRLETRFNTTFISPFQRFMETPKDAGFSVWHASGHKAESIASLPSAYRSELTRYRPELSEWIGND